MNGDHLTLIQEITNLESELELHKKTMYPDGSWSTMTPIDQRLYLALQRWQEIKPSLKIGVSPLSD